MKVVRTSDYKDLSQKAAIIIAARIITNSFSVLGLATGSTPEGVYEELIRLSKDGAVDFHDVTTFNLDEYFGLEKEHPQSYHYYMEQKLFNHVNIQPKRIHIPNGGTDNPDKECEEYERLIKEAGGIDLQLLGIGRNGHIGFNEPDDCFSKKTALVDLTEDTLAANARFFQQDEEMPKQAISMGIDTIMRAKSILLIAEGTSKKTVLYKAINEPITPKVPASILQLHPDVTVLYCN